MEGSALKAFRYILWQGYGREGGRRPFVAEARENVGIFLRV